MKKVWIGTSWKMNKTLDDAHRWSSVLTDYMNKNNVIVQAFVIPPFPYIAAVAQNLSNTQVKIGAQNMCWQDKGAYTGEVSPVMVKDCGASLVEIGHSERRALFGETDHRVNQKALAALAHNLTPLICVGDTAQDKAWGVSTETVIRQVKIALHNIKSSDIHSVIIAYEPVWAIGENGIPATNEEAAVMHDAIREILIQMYGQRIAQRMTLLYGGSVNLENAQGLLQQVNIDGLFVGRTAWDVNGFIKLIEIAEAKEA
ncbi:MAG: triose-phosphate isomerase [Psychromonas sp.]